MSNIIYDKNIKSKILRQIQDSIIKKEELKELEVIIL